MHTPTPAQLQSAKAAYQRYGSVTDFKNFRGDPMPEFEQLPNTIQAAWVAAVWPYEETLEWLRGGTDAT